MFRFRVPEVHLERQPHRYAVIRVRQAYRQLGQIQQTKMVAVSDPKSKINSSPQTIQEERLQ
jgi:hypothetical protein